MKTQIFPVFDPITEKFKYYKKREQVHQDGDWHKGVQANVIKKNKNGSFDILVQSRSHIVDIGQNKYDQSLATQMIKEDQLDEYNCLQRGLKKELGIIEYKCFRIDTHIRIVKTYEDNPSKLNREIITLFIVLIDAETQIIPQSKKVLSTKWMEWNEFLNFFHKNQLDFTKTAQFYFNTHELVKYIESMSADLIHHDDKIITTKNNSTNHKLSTMVFFHINFYDKYKFTNICSKRELHDWTTILLMNKQQLLSINPLNKMINDQAQNINTLQPTISDYL